MSVLAPNDNLGSSSAPFSMTIAGMARSAETFLPVYNPADGKLVGMAPDADVADLDAAVAAAQATFGAWAAMSWDARAGYLARFADAIEAESEALVSLLTEEQGKPRHSLALAEIRFVITFLRETAQLRLPVDVLRDDPLRRVEAHRVALGVVGAITPWNFPVQLSFWKIAPNLLVGNTVVVKPAPTTPLTLLRIGEIARELFPAGVINVISGGNDLGRMMTAHPDIAKISFTGSTATGRKVMASAAESLKRLTLELGGNDPAIVLPDADWRPLIPTLFWAAFYNSGQVCCATKRLYVHDSFYEDFLDAFVSYARSVRVGNGMDPATDLGPVQNQAQYDLLCGLIADSKASGHNFALGGDVDTLQPGFMLPVTIIDNPPEHSRIVQEEQFGPVLPVLRYKTVDEVIKRANASPMALAATVWGREVSDVAARLEAGTVWVNEASVFGADIPFNGHKQSGIGVELGLAGLAGCTNLKIYTFAR